MRHDASFTLTQQHDNGDKFPRIPSKNDETDNDDGDKGGGGGGDGGIDRVGKSRDDNDHDDNTRKNIYSLHGGYLCSIFAFGWCCSMCGIRDVDENDYFMKNYFSTGIYART